MPNDVAILGGGLTGVCAALELARGGIGVDLYERRTELIAEAGRVSEGKIHVGYVYANDRTLRTARRLVKGAVLFERSLGRWLDLHADPLELSDPFDYVVLRHSALSVADIASHFERVEDILAETEAALGARYLGRCFDHPFTRLAANEIARHYDGEQVAAVFRTRERCVDTWRLAGRLRAAVRATPGIRVRSGCTVRNLRQDDGRFVVSLASADGNRFDDTYRCIVNALWGGRLAIDAGIGLLPRRRWLYRYKFGIRLRLRPGTRLPPTCTLVHGSFGDVVSFPSGLTYLSWYPTGMVGTSDAVVPPDWDASVDQAARRRICDASIREMGTYLTDLRGLSDAVITERHIDGGVIVAWGATDIDDPASELHQRHDVGIHSTGNYHSVDPGKYTMAPMLAVELGDRIAGA